MGDARGQGADGRHLPGLYQLVAAVLDLLEHAVDCHGQVGEFVLEALDRRDRRKVPHGNAAHVAFKTFERKKYLPGDEGDDIGFDQQDEYQRRDRDDLGGM